MARTHGLGGHGWFALPSFALLSLAAGACAADGDALGSPDASGAQGADRDAGGNDAAASDAAQPDAADLTTIRSIGMGNSVTCAVLSTGSVRCWGANEQGQVGAGVTDSPQPTPIDVIGLTDAVSVDCGTAHCCARTEAGGARCWGWNAAGELGANMAPGDLPNRATAGAVIELPTGGSAAELSGASQVAAGGAHNCAVEGGDVWCWGWNLAGQSGMDPVEGTVIVAKPTGIADVTALALAHAFLAEHSCAITAAGAIACWGRNLEGQLGDGTMTTRYAAAPVSGLAEATALAAGQQHTCAIAREAGAPDPEPAAVWCWGQNNFGQAGPDAGASTTTPVEVHELSGAIALAAGQSHTCALLATGGVRCWGANNFGQLGDGTTDSTDEPTDVVNPDGNGLLSGVDQVVAGFGNTCAHTTSGQVYCWGANDAGQLGQGISGEDNAVRPVAVPVVPEP